MPTTRSGMTPKYIKEMITQCVAEAMATYQADRNIKNIVKGRDDMEMDVETVMGMEMEKKTETGMADRNIKNIVKGGDDMEMDVETVMGMEMEKETETGMRFQELSLLFPKMVPEEGDKIE
nr:hypothetical protein [Tanacetum cinerariifolium]